MIWFLSSRPIILSDVSFIVQIIAFMLLLYSITKVKIDLVNHGVIARLSFSVAIISIIYMIYSSIRGFSTSLPSDIQSIMFIHKLLGFAAIVFGILFVFNQWKWKVKKYMVTSFLAWFGAMVLGIFVFVKIFIW
jgi:hypothetical protein